MSKHTAGPWKAAPFSSVVGCPIIAYPEIHKPVIVAGTRSALATDPDGFRAEVEANARLIAAAPDLLALARDYRKVVAFEIKRDRLAGDDEGARMKTFTLDDIDRILAEAGDEK